MMRSVNMYIIIIITLMMTISGLPQTCLHYCKLSPVRSSIAPSECDCSFHHLRKPRSTTKNHHIVTPLDRRDENYNEPAKLKSTQLNFSSNVNFTQDASHNIKFNKNNDGLTVAAKTKGLPLHLYLDIDLDTLESSNTAPLEELKNMFENFRGTENNLSECINLHIYIFSKYVNKTNTDWDHIVKHDTLSNSQELTEIQNKCGQPSSIIKQSLYQIKQTLPKTKSISEIVQDKEEKNYSLDSKEDTIKQYKLLLSQNINNSTISNDSHTLTTSSTNNNYDITSETLIAEESNDVQSSDNKYSEQDDLSLLINEYHKKQSAFTSSLSNYNDDTLLSPTGYNASHVESITESSELGGIRTTIKPNRTVYNEADIQIPRIITKELSNDSVLSVIDGNEEIPNSDFIPNSIISTISNENPISNDGPILNVSMSNTDLLKTNIDNINKSNLVEIRGNLYLLFDKKQIPARFIQQPTGELHVAIDGFSLCNQILEENTSNFISAFCKCIQHQN